MRINSSDARLHTPEDKGQQRKITNNLEFDATPACHRKSKKDPETSKTITVKMPASCWLEVPQVGHLLLKMFGQLSLSGHIKSICLCARHARSIWLEPIQGTSEVTSDE